MESLRFTVPARAQRLIRRPLDNVAKRLAGVKPNTTSGAIPISERTNLIEFRQIYKSESRRFFRYGWYSLPFLWGGKISIEQLGERAAGPILSLGVATQITYLGMSRIEHSIPRIAQSRYNELVHVQNRIDRPHKYVYVRVFRV